MKTKSRYRIVSLLILLSCCYMTGVRMLHHHPAVLHSDSVCTIDGETLCTHHAHSHDSYLPAVLTDDDCAICHFQVVKLQRPSLSLQLTATLTRQTVYTRILLVPVAGLVRLSPCRAPPVC